MTRFRVIKGATILMVFAVMAVIAAICLIVLTAKNEESAVSAMANMEQIEICENEHTDDAATDVKIGRVLIYHTHTHEAYTPEYDGEYAETEKWRTTDNEHNIVKVGSVLAEELENLGIETVHDTTDHEQSELSTAYSRSLKTLEKYDMSDFDLIIDLHRDAYSEGMTLTCAVSESDIECARLMMLIGKGEKFNVKPDYTKNSAYAEKLTYALNSENPGICRDVLVKTGRYNQHMTSPAILIEVGNNHNTLSEAIAAVKPLAQAIYETLTNEAIED